jgi:hypothetical protein
MSIKKQSKWIPLTLYKNCFKDGEKTHLGFKHNGKFYVLTHSKSKVTIPKKHLRMNHSDEETVEYLTKAIGKPIPVNSTNMRLARSFFHCTALKILEKRKPIQEEWTSTYRKKDDL